MKLENDKVAPFGTALYESQCPTCGENVEWSADFDADGTVYRGKHCGLSFRLYPETVMVSVEGVSNDGSAKGSA